MRTNLVENPQRNIYALKLYIINKEGITEQEGRRDIFHIPYVAISI